MTEKNSLFGAYFFATVSDKLGQLAQNRDRREWQSLFAVKISDAGFRPPIFAEATDTIAHAAQRMKESRRRSIFVRDGSSTGIFTTGDFCDIVANAVSNQTPLKACAQFSLLSCEKDDYLFNALLLMFTIFVGASLWITKWAAKRTRSAADFYTAGGGITGFQNGLAIAGDFMSAASFLGISAAVMSRQFTPAEQAVLRIVQDNLPDSLTPYADIAEKAGMTENQVLELLGSLKESGAIRRFGASIKHQKTGWTHNAMALKQPTSHAAPRPIRPQRRASALNSHLSACAKQRPCWQQRRFFRRARPVCFSPKLSSKVS